MSVKVGVRVRPFNQREIDLNSRLCVDMIGPMTRLFDADDPDKHRDFTFDYSFWSHDQFVAGDGGYLKGDTDKYADQQQVFEKVGLEILSNAWDGYHCCLFAYGQTGSGKSYSMVGYGANKGIVPISCEQIFNRISNNPNKDKEYEVNVSMLEIYNEKVQDLLIPINKRQKEGFKIREHKTLGIYVQGLSKHYVNTYELIEKKMEEGGRNRSIAATQMNANSSRAHTIISIEFKQIEVVGGKKREKLSVIYLVDLAGSQKVGKTGATGDRLKEAAGINKSLSVLGLVISTLADKSMGKGKDIVVPYRNSCLTRILQNALGGNSKTLMICAISPATDNYEETLSTLRYADQAKKIQNKAVVNESETDKIIRTLTQQKDELRDKVQKMQEMFKKLSTGLGLAPQMMEQLNDAKQQLRFNDQMMNDYSMTNKEKLQHEMEIVEDSKTDKTRPHISNLNEDPQLSRKIHYQIDTDKTKIGKRNVEPPNDIEIGGMGIRQLHAVIEKNEEGKFHIYPIDLMEDSSCYLNGDMITERTQIMQYDRLTFGTNNMFIVLIPETEPREPINEEEINWEFAQNELYLKKEKQNEEKEKKIKQENEALLRQKEDELAKLQQFLKESEEARVNMEQQKEREKADLQKKFNEEKAQKLRQEIQNEKKKVKDSQSQQKERFKEKYYFEKKLLKTLPKCIELNLIAKEFKRNITMSVKMMLLDEDGEDGEMDMKKRSIKIKVVNREVGYTYWWDVNKLSNRYYIIKDMSERYFETGVVPNLAEKDDPFWDPPEQTLIGRGFLTTKALAYMFDNPVTLPIIGEDDHCGQLIVNLVPTDETGTHNLCEEMDEQEEFEPQQLLERPFYFNLLIEKAIVPSNYEGIYVEYALRTNEYEKETFRTENVAERTTTPNFNYVKLHTFPVITQLLLEYLTTSKLVFKVYGCEMIPEKKDGADSGKSKLEPDVVKAKKQAESKEGKNTDHKAANGSSKKPAIVLKNQTSTSHKPGGPSTTMTTPTTKQPGNKIPKKTDKDKDCLIF